MSKLQTARQVFYSVVIAGSVISTGCSARGVGAGATLIVESFKLGKAVSGRGSSGSSYKKMDRNDRANFVTALERNRDNAPMGWTNSRNGIAYQVTPLSDYVREENIRCRRYETEVYARSSRRVFQGEACREANGKWKEARK